MARIQTSQYSIQQAFRECFYIVPYYQREYVWTETEVEQPLNDIEEQIETESGEEYFIGTILVAPAVQKDQFEVIDGQQRLTTLFLLLCALKNLFEPGLQRKMIEALVSTDYSSPDGEVHTALKLDVRYENASQAIARLASDSVDSASLPGELQAAGVARFGSLDRLIKAYETIHQHLQKFYSDPIKLKKFWGYLSTNVCSFKFPPM